MGEPWILAIDLGTGGPKTAAVTLRGEILAHAAHTVATHYTDSGGASQDPSQWWDGIRAGGRQLIAGGAAPDDIAGVGITGQWGSTVPVDADGLPVGECL
ncbi:MAG TPA: FGGY family carbohydrate kinase, partial [Candidatus Deferrimicrobium sp.]|nr:FGGY family carbohydrate kinase [Candidatus Deferrimicrobium sp.]